jgi:predicted glutamine amidotransferase
MLQFSATGRNFDSGGSMLAAMCRLFAMTGGREPVTATFWLLEAADSLVQQSHNNPDGTGIGWFDEGGIPQLNKQPMAGFEDTKFAEAARTVTGKTILAHVRYASGTGLTAKNTHPFLQHGRLFAHNGVVQDLDVFKQGLGSDEDMNFGDTDSERLFSMITHEIAAADGDVRTGIIEGVKWVLANVHIYSINFVLTTEEDVWAFRYPEGNELHYLDRIPDAFTADEPLRHRTEKGRIAVHSNDLSERRVVVVASEPMDEDPRWTAVEVGELVHVDGDLNITVEQIVEAPAAHQLTLKDLAPSASESQMPLN